MLPYRLTWGWSFVFGTGQAILEDVGRAMEVRMSSALAQAEAANKSGGLSPAILAGVVILGFGLAGLGYEIGRRRRA